MSVGVPPWNVAREGQVPNGASSSTSKATLRTVSPLRVFTLSAIQTQRPSGVGTRTSELPTPAIVPVGSSWNGRQVAGVFAARAYTHDPAGHAHAPAVPHVAGTACGAAQG